MSDLYGDFDDSDDLEVRRLFALFVVDVAQANRGRELQYVATTQRGSSGAEQTQGLSRGYNGLQLRSC